MLKAFLATVYKELLLLARDRTGLLVLFAMPAVLVVVVSLVQENVLKATGETAIDILFVDQDRQAFGQLIRDQLGESGNARLVTAVDGRELDAETARALVEKSRFQVGIVVPAGTTAAVRRRAAAQISAAFAGAAAEDAAAPPQLSVYFDPLVHGAFRSAILNGLRQTLLAKELEIKAQALAESLPVKVQQAFRTAGRTAGGLAFPGAASGPALQMDPSWGTRRLMEVVAEQSRLRKLPTSVQHNVPAWAVFGIFFIVLPLGGVIIRERQEGTLDRLRTLPVPYLVLILGKLCAFLIVCWGQFLFVLLVGRTLLPLLGAPVLSLGLDWPSLGVIVTAVALAACGFGVMLGTLARSFEQAAIIGAVSVVCAAALGGIMVPVYAMPPAMQTVSRFSPLAWGLNALVEVFVREGTLAGVWRELGYLAAFFGVTLAIAWAAFNRTER
jgi:ABC-2 type transport system permease protein